MQVQSNTWIIEPIEMVTRHYLNLLLGTKWAIHMHTGAPLYTPCGISSAVYSPSFFCLTTQPDRNFFCKRAILVVTFWEKVIAFLSVCSFYYHLKFLTNHSACTQQTSGYLMGSVKSCPWLYHTVGIVYTNPNTISVTSNSIQDGGSMRWWVRTNKYRKN